VKHVVVVGSGASGVHFAQSALENGWRVTMVDVGRVAPAPVLPDASFAAFKRESPDPAGYFLGRKFEGALFPGAKGEFYGFPPHKGFIFAPLDRTRVRSQGFDPLMSFARGGLAEAWTGGLFPFTAGEMVDFPFEYADFAPYYGLVAARIGVSGAADDLARFLPAHEHLAPGVELDEHSRVFLAKYERVKQQLNRDLRCYVGRSRAAVRGDDRKTDIGERKGCTKLGRCLWSCPREALYTPSLTLRALQSDPNFTYVPDHVVTRIEVDDRNRVRRLHAEHVSTGSKLDVPVERLALAAGTLASAKLFLDSLRAAGGSAPVLTGLMDNRQVLVPFVNFAMLRKRVDFDTYQYHQLALGLERDDARHYVHGLITTLKSALIHPIVQSVPFDLASSLWIFRNAHAALGLVNVNFHDDRRAECTLSIEDDAKRGSQLVVRYEPSREEPTRMNAALGDVKKALRALGCIAPPGMTHVRPMGASVHYAGALPMTRDAAPLTTTPLGESRDVAGLYFVDGSTFPFLPAKNLTFTLMANAARIADAAFER